MLELQHRLRMLRYSLITVLSLPVLLFSSFETELSYVFLLHHHLVRFPLVFIPRTLYNSPRLALMTTMIT